MGLFKKLFKKEKKEVVKKDEAEEIQEDFTGRLLCAYCGKPIEDWEKVKTFAKKKYHVKPCWRRIMKDAKKGMADGSLHSLNYMNA